MTPEGPNQHRREIIGRLEYQYKQAQTKHSDAEANAAKAKGQMMEIEAALLRAERFPNRPDVCPECWIIHGRESDLYAVPHEDPAHFDRMQCGTCGYFENRTTGH